MFSLITHNESYIFCKIKFFGIYSISHIDRESFSVIRGLFSLGNLQEIVTWEEKNEPAEEIDSGIKKKKKLRRRKVAWEMQLINWRIIVRY